MSFPLNEKLLRMTPYDPIEGEYPIRLDANESFLLPEGELLEQMKEAVTKTAFNRYPDPYAKEACRCFAAYYQIEPEFVTAGNGSDELISIIMNAFLQKGDKVLTVHPDFSMYRFYTSVVECPCISLEKNSDLTIPVEKVLETLKNEHIRMLVFSNPCNPTSIGLSAESVRKILRSTSALVVLDEAYMDFWDQSLLREAEAYDNLIVLRTCSKALGMAAIRLGFAVANKVLTSAIRAVKSPYNVNALSQAIACVLFSNPQLLEHGRELVLKSRRTLLAEVKKIQELYPNLIRVTESVTNFVLIRTQNAGDVFLKLKEAGIIVRCMGDYLRVSAGSPDENETFLRVFRTLLEEENQ